MYSRRVTTAAVAVWCAACGGGTSDVTLDLADGDGDCMGVFSQVMTISIESIARNGECRLAHECAYGVSVDGGVAQVEEALRGAGDVLLELDAGEAQVVVVNGRPMNNCFPLGTMNTPVMCGSNELDQAEDGVLTLELECSGCPESMELCP